MPSPVEPMNARERPDEQLEQLFGDGWPQLVTAYRSGRRSGAADAQGALPDSQTMAGTVSDWEARTGLLLPDSGEYVIPQGLSTPRADRELDRGSASSRTSG
jgi:hypothetical protein